MLDTLQKDITLNQLLSDQTQISLAHFPRDTFNRGRSLFIQSLWRLAAFLLASPLTSFLGARRLLLRLFGAKISKGVLLKGRLRVRYPWRLTIGRDSWIGEDCWIDNWESVIIGNDVCISQSAYICTGNHDWADPYFAIKPQPISIGDGAWIGARAVIGPGVELGVGAIAGIGSVVTSSVPAWEVHGGNPARFVKRRQIRTVGCHNSVNREVD